MRSLVLFFFLALVFAISAEEKDPVVQEDHPSGVDSALVAHVQETGLERVMRVKRYCGCCGGMNLSAFRVFLFRMLWLWMHVCHC